MAMLASLFWTFLLLGSCHCYIDKTIYQYLVDNGYSLFVQLLKETGQDRILSGTATPLQSHRTKPETHPISPRTGDGPRVQIPPNPTAHAAGSKQTQPTPEPIPPRNDGNESEPKQLRSIEECQDVERFLVDHGDWLADQGYFGWRMRVEDKEDVYHSLLKQLIFYRTTAEIAQFTSGVDEVFGLWAVMKAHPGQCLQLLSCPSTPLTKEDFVALFTTVYSEQGSNKRQEEEETIYSWEIFLQDIEVPVTVFAPDNAAMARMDLNIMTSLNRNPWQKINLAKYHIVDDFVLIPFLHGQQSIMTTAGQKIALTFSGSSITLNNASHLLAPSKDDIILNNGVIQPIDSVLIPPLYSPDNLFAILLERDDIFLDFPLALMLSNLSQLIEHGEYTIFAPVDAAYAIYTDSILHPRGNVSRDVAAKIFYEMNKYHIVPGARGLDSLTHGQILYTLHGTPLNITVLTNGYMVNQAHVVEGDIPASNGVVHAIDSVLFPTDLLPSLGIDPASLSTARP